MWCGDSFSMGSFNKKCIAKSWWVFSKPVSLWYKCKLSLVITDLAPALESFTSSDIVGWNLNTLHDVRKNFIKAESSERIKQALWHNVRTYCEENYQNGDKLFYKRRAVKG